MCLPGKTTAIRLLLDLLRPQSGSMELFGRCLDRSTRQTLGLVGALVESPSLYGHLTGRENLEATRRLLDLPRARIDAALARVGLLKLRAPRIFLNLRSPALLA